ncbi:MAG TPA: acyl-CoA desaturase [Pyrinomonadaceae bacterium]|nr:acyl-CoA desaturase [Pyrinomonadaceae bacterium]
MNAMIETSPATAPGARPDELQSARLNARATRLARRVALATVILPFLGFLVSVALLWQRAFGIVDLGLLVVFYVLTTMGIGIGFHRLFAHRGFQTGPRTKVILAILGSMAAEGPVLFWAAIHRRHHSYSDRTGDPHSPHLHGEGVWNTLRGFWHAHSGWMFRPELTGWAYYVPDLLRDRLLFQINRLYFLWMTLGLLLPAVLGGLLTLSWRGALLGFLWGGLVRVFLVHHTTWSINSICHMYGNRPFQTRDFSANNFWMALLSFGEGWHNNHHAFPSSVRHGLQWWQIDMSGYVIQTMKAAGLAWNVKLPSPRMVAEAKKKNGDR